jgi:hypothetical protein
MCLMGEYPTGFSLSGRERSTFVTLKRTRESRENLYRKAAASARLRRPALARHLLDAPIGVLHRGAGLEPDLASSELPAAGDMIEVGDGAGDDPHRPAQIEHVAERDLEPKPLLAGDRLVERGHLVEL